MAVNSFVIWPISIIFLVYAAGRALIFLEWKTLVLAGVIFVIATIAQMAISILAD